MPFFPISWLILQPKLENKKIKNNNTHKLWQKLLTFAN